MKTVIKDFIFQLDEMIFLTSFTFGTQISLVERQINKLPSGGNRS